MRERRPEPSSRPATTTGRGPIGRALRRLARSTILRDRRAATAVEFGLLALPFLALMGAIFESALSFLAGQILDTAVNDASRLIRTGQAQAGGYSQAKFTTEVCNRLYVLFDCNNLSIDSKVYTNFTSANTSMPIDSSGNFDKSGFTFQMGGSSEIVVVRAFYPYPLYFSKLGLDLSNLANGTRLLAGVSAFRNEPFPW